jgi:Flp pilus assembly pilin Flp
MRKRTLNHQREGSPDNSYVAMTSGTESGGAATPMIIRRTLDVPAAYAAHNEPVDGHLDTSSPRLIEARRWRVRRKRKEVKHVLKLFTFADSLRRSEDGQTMAEYGVVLAVIAIAVFAALGLLRDEIVTAIEEVATLIGGAG